MLMRYILTPLLLLTMAFPALSQKGDTLWVKPQDLNIKGLQTGDYTYLISHHKPKDSVATGMALVKMNVERTTYHNKAAIVVKQQWEKDSIIHTSYSVFDAKDFSTLLHDTYWSQLGYALIFDFETRTFSSRKVLQDIPDSIKKGCEDELAASFGKYNLNWHEDLIIYSMLPYKENRTFMINYYDPGFGKPAEVAYTVSGSDKLTGRGGESIDCWVLSYEDADATQRFWVSKKTNEVLKEEDHGKQSGGYRFKYKLGISGT
jgi:hypothetical protein